MPEDDGLVGRFLQPKPTVPRRHGEAFTCWKLCSVAPEAATARALASDATLEIDCAVLRIADALSVTARSTPPIAARNDSNRCFNVPGSLFARLGVLQDLRIEAALPSIAPWKIWIARASAPISSARSVCGTSTFSAPSATRLMVAVMTARWPRDQARDDQDSDHDHDQRQTAETGQGKRQGAIDIALPDDLLAALGIDLGKCFEILVEGGTHGAIGVIVAPLAPAAASISTPRRTSSLRKSTNCSIRFLKTANCSESSAWTMDSQSLTTPRSVH